MSNTPIGHVV